MSLISSLSTILVSAVILSAPSEANASSSLETALEGYEATGESSRCVVRDNIQDIEFIDDRTWLFEMYGDRAFLTTLSRSCQRARDPFNAIIGQIQGPRLCSGGRGVSIMNRAEAGRINSRAVGAQPSDLSNTCRLGRFVEYRKSDHAVDPTD